MMKSKNIFYGIIAVCVLIIVGIGLFVYLNKTGPFSKVTKGCAKEGETAKADEDIICCRSLESFQNIEEPDCTVIGKSINGHHICINCGNGKCGIGENKCNCPQDCDVTGCIGEGDTFFPNDGNKCCAGLRGEWNYEMLKNGDCNDIQGTLGHQKVCVKCRDGICGKGENGCNCPQDCKDFKCIGHGEIPRYTAPGDDMSIQCCEGLRHRTQKKYFEENCKEQLVMGYPGICLACGDGKCDLQYESKCNCPEDCK